MALNEIKSFFVALFASTNPDISAACEDLALQNRFTTMQIEQSRAVTEREDLSAFCQITGSIDPNIGFEARFPLTAWNGKYYQAGCGGFCGRVLPDRETHSNAINHALRRGYATVTTDGGHQGQSIGDASWATNPVAEKTYAREVLPRTHAAAHQLIETLYGHGPEYSYFSGCSNGGRLAGKAVQEYPDLFDGVIAGCPVLNLSHNGGIFGSWVMQANLDANGQPILGTSFKAKLPLLEANALAQCDALDGVVDGAIQKPFACQVSLDPITTCAGDNTSQCLTTEEKSVVRKLYDGAQNSNGEKLFYGAPAGSERYWGFWYLGSDERPAVGTLLAEGFLPYLGFAEDPKNYTALDFNFDTDVSKLVPQSALLDAQNPDLSAFKKAGGKLIMWHGLADPLVLPQQSEAYYQAVRDTMGAAETDAFFRLFLAPGMGHCWELPAALPDRMSMLQALENWVEKGIAPEEVALKEFEKGPQTGRHGALKPYPQQAVYSQ